MSATRRHFLFGALAAPMLAADKKDKKRAAPERPSILLILGNELPSWMLGCYGNTEIHTPNIDRLAQTGMRFVNHTICTPASSASRATLFTGRTPRQTGVVDFLTAGPAGNPPEGQAAPPASFAQEVMISDVLAGAGYHCGYAGEWRLGNDNAPQHGCKFWETAVVREKGNWGQLITAKAAEFLDQQRPGEPFFLTVGYLNPHPPYEGTPQEYAELYAGVKFETFNYQAMAPNAARDKEMFRDFLPNLRKCAASTTALDDQIPLLLEKLRARGLMETTLIIFTSDTGLLLGQHGLWGRGVASQPVNMYREVMDTPMIWSWLGHVPPSNTRPELVSTYDLLPTLCELTGSPVPQGRNLPGRSYMPLAFDRKLPKKEPWRNLVFGEYHNTEMARDTRYKLVLRDQGKSPSEFYDLTADPRERTNQYDNPQYVDMRNHLAGELADWRKKF
jgi:arylsulfatase A-like enzyme